MSLHPYQLDPVVFCQFHHGLMAVHDKFGFMWKQSGALMAVRKNMDAVTCVSPFYVFHYTFLNGICFSVECCYVDP